MTTMKRRNFLKLMASGIGGVFLTACGSSSNNSRGGNAIPTPNGYAFYPVMSTGDTLPTGSTAAKLSPVLMINDNSEVLAHYVDGYDAHGVYEHTIDYTGAKPTVAQTRKILREGDILRNGVEVDHFHVGSTNKNGNFAIRISDKRNGIPKIYLERNKEGLVPVVNPHDPLPGMAGKFAAGFGDLDLDDTNALFLVSHYLPEGENAPKEGLFFLTDGGVTDYGSLVLSSGDLVPGAGSTVNRIGLIDSHPESGDYVTQLTCGLPQGMTNGTQAEGNRVAQTAIVYGSVGQPATRSLKAAARSINLSRAAALDAIRGDVFHGPRIGGDNNIAYVVHTSETSTVLYLDGRRVLGTGDQTPLGNMVVGFSGPLVGKDGLLHFCTMTDRGTELCLFDRVSVHSILAAGERIEMDGERIVALDFGAVRNMVDSKGRLVFLATFENGNKSVVLGIPV
jgi:hypothetical protein